MSQRGITVHEKLKKFNDLHVQYLEYTNKQQHPLAPTSLGVSAPVSSPPSVDVRLGNIPKQYQPRANEVLEWLKKRSDVITWDPVTGEAQYRGQKIHGSNISDLIRDSVVPNGIGAKRAIKGEDVFWNALLNEINVPQSLLRKRVLPPPLNTSSGSDTTSSPNSSAMESALDISGVITPVKKTRTATPLKKTVKKRPPTGKNAQKGKGMTSFVKRVGRPSWITI